MEHLYDQFQSAKAPFAMEGWGQDYLDLSEYHHHLQEFAKDFLLVDTLYKYFADLQQSSRNRNQTNKDQVEHSQFLQNLYLEKKNLQYLLAADLNQPLFLYN